MDIVYAVSPTFQKVHKDTNPYIFVMGPVGSGKSSGCIWHAFFNAMRQTPDENGVRKYRHLVVRATYPELRASVIKTWIEWFKDKLKLTYTMPIVGRLVYPLADGTTVDMEILFTAVDSAQTVEKLRSLEVSSIHINEAAEIPEGVFTLLKTRFKRYPAMPRSVERAFAVLQDEELPDDACGVVNPFIIMDYNAVNTEHWLYKLAEITKPDKHSFYKQPAAVLQKSGPGDSIIYEVNPQAENLTNLVAGYYEDQVHGSPEDFIRVNLMNQYGDVRHGRPVYKDYNDSKHYIDKTYTPVKSTVINIGLDLGLTPAAVFTQQDSTGRVVVFDEIVTEDCSISEFLEEKLWPRITKKYTAWLRNYCIYVDPAARQRSSLDAVSPLQFMRNRRLNVKIARTNDPLRRIDAVAAYLRTPEKFSLHDGCPVIRRGFISGYMYKKIANSEDRYRESPDKNEFSHVHDALQYAVLAYEPPSQRRHQVGIRDVLGKGRYPTRSRYRVPSSIGGY